MDPDGGVTIYISHVLPDGVPQANWLPVGTEDFNVMLRVYGVINGSNVHNNTYDPVTRAGGRSRVGERCRRTRSAYAVSP